MHWLFFQGGGGGCYILNYYCKQRSLPQDYNNILYELLKNWMLMTMQLDQLTVIFISWSFYFMEYVFLKVILSVPKCHHFHTETEETKQQNQQYQNPLSRHGHSQIRRIHLFIVDYYTYASFFLVWECSLKVHTIYIKFILVFVCVMK